MITVAAGDASRVATTAAQAIIYERHTGVRAALALLVHPFAEQTDALEVLLRSVERQAFLDGLGRRHLDLDPTEAA